MKEYLEKWSWMRVIQLIVGGVFLSNYFAEGGTFTFIFGALMTFQAIANVGCFSTKGCATPVSNVQPGDIDNQEVEYEEIE